MNVPLGEPPAPTPGITMDPSAPLEAPVGGSHQRRPTLAERYSGPRSRRATYVVLGFVGVELGLIGSFLSLQTLHLAGLAVPLGPVLAVLANLVTGLWAVRITGNRSAAAAPALGWLLTVLLLSSSRGEGDVVITNSGRGVAFLLLGALAWVAAAVGGRFVLPAQPT